MMDNARIPHIPTATTMPRKADVTLQGTQVRALPNMAEIEIGIMSRQCLRERIPSKQLMSNAVAAWTACRNAASLTINWHFSTQDARIKLKHLYPKY